MAEAVALEATIQASAVGLPQDTPIPISFPAFRGHPFQLSKVTRQTTESSRLNDEGRRRLRRRENDRFASNPHIVPATSLDYQIVPPRTRPTFPRPLPNGIPRSSYAPSPPIPTFDIASANSGKFRMSVRGLRRVLCHSGPRVQTLVQDVERELRHWLNTTHVIFMPDASLHRSLDIPGQPIDSSGTVYEVSRTPSELIWSISGDPFARYVVHCTARLNGIVSFSKDHPTHNLRLTHILRPNITRIEARTAIRTPPTTDHDTSSVIVDTDSEFASDSEYGFSQSSRELRDALPSLSEMQEATHKQSTLSDGDDQLEFADDEANESDGFEVLSMSVTSLK